MSINNRSLSATGRIATAAIVAALAITAVEPLPALAGSAPAPNGVAASQGTSDATDFSAARRYRRYRGIGPAGPLAFMGAVLGVVGAVQAQQAREDYYNRQQYYQYYGAPYPYAQPYQYAPAYGNQYYAPHYTLPGPTGFGHSSTGAYRYYSPQLGF